MKRIVICCDGTWQRPVQSYRGKAAPSNVARLAASVAREDHGIQQLTYYDQGLGTANLADAFFGGAFGIGLDQKIIEAYRFLTTHYELGDELYLFGFSRGAYTVRSLAGLIRKCGIPRREKLLNESNVIDLYRSTERADAPRPRALRRHNSVNGEAAIPIQCIGVWDTVGALGIPGALGLPQAFNKRYAFHDTQLSRSVKFAFHAVSVDERRRSFTPTLWTGTPAADQTVEQVWFSGTHSDVGGGIGSVGLPPITLAWMRSRAARAGLALEPVNGPAEDPLARFNWLERSFLWRPLGRHVRPIGYVQADGSDTLIRDPTQSVAPSVDTRYRALPSYRPSNLIEFRERELEAAPRAEPAPSAQTRA